MLYILALMILVVVAALWWLYATRTAQHVPLSADNRPAANRYRCVEVCPGNTACKAARSLGNVRFLYQDAPRLPFPGCSEQQCTCNFIYHDDRREQATRKPDALWAGHPYATTGARRSGNTRHNIVPIDQRWSHTPNSRSIDSRRTTRG